jgi:hypothetical protein
MRPPRPARRPSRRLTPRVTPRVTPRPIVSRPRSLPAFLSLLSAFACSCASPPARDLDAVPTGNRALAAVGACGVEVSKLNYNQVGADNGALELIELHVRDFKEGATFADCGVTHVVPWEGGKGGCAEEAASRAIEVGPLVIPPGGIALLGRGGEVGLSPLPDATTKSKSGPFLENGPDLLVLRAGEAVVLTLAVGAKGVYPACSPPGYEGPVVQLPEDDDGTSGEEHILVLCPDGYRKVPLSGQVLRGENQCHEETPATGEIAGGSGSGAAGENGGAGGGGKGSAGGGGKGSAGSGGKGSAGGNGNGSSGAAGEGTCRVLIDKFDVDQPDLAGEPRDAREAVELRVEGPVVAGKTTLADCGVASLSPFNANVPSDVEQGACGPAAGFYGEVPVGALTVPVSRRLVIGNVEEAAQHLASSSSALQNGPDVITLRASSGEIVGSVSYPARTGGPLAACLATAGADAAPADEGEPGASAGNTVVVRCPERGWTRLPELAARWGQAPDCQAVLASGGAGKPGAGGAGGAGGAPARGSHAGAGGEPAAAAGAPPIQAAARPDEPERGEGAPACALVYCHAEPGGAWLAVAAAAVLSQAVRAGRAGRARARRDRA